VIVLPTIQCFISRHHSCPRRTSQSLKLAKRNRGLQDMQASAKDAEIKRCGWIAHILYYLVCNQPASLFSSHCFALLPAHPRRSSCRIDRRRFRQPRGVLCWLRSSPCCSRYRPNACLYILFIASTSSSLCKVVTREVVSSFFTAGRVSVGAAARFRGQSRELR
jgi:hypothetical protein